MTIGNIGNRQLITIFADDKRRAFIARFFLYICPTTIKTNMKIRKINTSYQVKTWVSECTNCGCEYEFTMKDTHMYKYGTAYPDFKTEYYVQCPCCGNWRRTLIK